MTQYKKNHIHKSHEYFELFNQYNLDGLKEIYAKNIELVDWNGEWKGRDAVLQTNADLFAAKPIIEVLEVIQSDKENEGIQRTYCKIKITLGDATLKVIDVIDWNDDHKITKIEAYNG